MNTRAELVRAYAERAKSHGLSVAVPADGAFHSQIAIVGEAPGEREISTHIPFSGGAGKVLWDALRKHGIGRQDVYITNVLKRQVALGAEHGDERASASRGELQHWYELVRWELEQLPNVRFVLLLGNYALEAFTGETGITKWRGSVWPGKLLSRDVHFIATFNPAMVLREPKTAITFNFDINKLSRVMAGKFHVVNITSHINPSYDDAVEWVEKMRHDAYHGSPVSFDIEVIAYETACIGLASSGTEGMCINFRGMDVNRFPVEQEREIRKRIATLFADERVRLVAQNGQFDSYWLGYKDRIHVPRVWFDTLLAHHTMYPTLPHDLGFLTAQYTDHPYYKDEGKQWREKGDIDAFWRYNVTDACITYTVQKREQQELATQGLDGFFYNHVMRLQPHLINATVLGVACDYWLKEHIKEQLTEDTSKLLATFHERVHTATGQQDYFPNPRSPKQLAELFFYKLKLVGRGTATDSANRKRMRAHPRTPPVARDVLDSLDTYTREHKFLSTYAEMTIDPDRRIRCEYKQFGTQTAPGRLSSSKVLWGAGMNLQNQPRRSQAMFIADEGYGFGYFDLSQAEARYVAWDASIESWIDQFERARIDGQFGAHRALASDMFNVPYDKVPKKDRDADGEPTIRYIAKRCHTPDTEVLTYNGWTPIATAAFERQVIAVWDETGAIGWELPSRWHVEQVDESIYEFAGESANQCVTGDHRMPVYNNGKLGERTAEEVYEKAYGAMPIHGVRRAGEHQPLARLYAMAWADGTIEPKHPNSVRVSVKKERKADRVRMLASEAGLRLWEGRSGGMFHFRVYGIHFKALGPFILQWDLSSRIAFLDELKFWNGCPNTGRVFNTDLDGLGIIQAAAHISGFRAPIHKHGTPKENEKQCYMIRPTTNASAHYSSMERTKMHYTGDVYCPTVTTGAFLVRRNLRVSVSLNCRHGLNYRMGADKLAEVTGLTSSQAEHAYEVYHARTPELRVWWDTITREVRRSRALYNSLGRRLQFLERLDDSALESIVAFRPQSTIGDKVCQVWYQSEDDAEWPRDARICLNIHDALICLAPLNKLARCLSIMKRYAEEPINVQSIVTGKTRQMIIPVETKVSVPTVWSIDEEGKLIYTEREDGRHRWYGMKPVHIEV